MDTELKWKDLIQAALEGKTMAYTPYSKFQVGAALLGKNGDIFTGCNVENAAYSPTTCAERTAIVKAISHGVREFEAIAIVGSLIGNASDYCYPCGVCRQLLREFVPDDFPIIIAKTTTDYRVHTLGELLPHSFGASDLLKKEPII